MAKECFFGLLSDLFCAISAGMCPLRHTQRLMDQALFRFHEVCLVVENPAFLMATPLKFRLQVTGQSL